jgi:hypothetical protein
MRPSIFDRVSKAGNIERNVVASYVAAEELREIKMRVEHVAGAKRPQIQPELRPTPHLKGSFIAGLMNS